ncbi:MAG: MarR family transcriptional regulator [Thermodesulfobacteriota bacterium]|nr:MarR family transcriptional regulator [Thermodesulfobacteriota bacterium]
MKSEYIINIIARIHEKYNRMIIAALNEKGITDLVPSHGEILYVLHNGERLTMNEIAQAINRSKPTVTVLTRKLETAGYIRKRKNETDSRSVYVELSEKGKQFIPGLFEISEKMIAQTYKGMSKKTQKEVMAALLTIYHNL